MFRGGKRSNANASSCLDDNLILSDPLNFCSFHRSPTHGDFTVCDFNDRDNDVFVCWIVDFVHKRGLYNRTDARMLRELDLCVIVDE